MGLHWFILIAFLLIVIQARIYYRYGLRRMSYSRSFDTTRAMEGETVHLVEKVANEKWLPLPWLRVESQIDAHLKFKQTFDLVISSGEKFQNHVSLFSLPPYVEIVRKHKVECTKRGRYELQSAYMTTGDFLGWSRTSQPVSSKTVLLVHPRLVPFEEIPIPTHSWQGDVTVRRWIVEDPFMNAGIREYRSGDPFNRIHWQATARTGQLHVVKNDYTADHRLMIFLNFEVSETMWKAVIDPELVEHGIRYAASIAQRYIALGMAVGFGCNGMLANQKEKRAIRIEAVSGFAHLQTLYDTMASLHIERGLPFETFLDEEIRKLTKNVDYIVITAYENEGIAARFDALRKNGNSVMAVPLVKPEMT